MAINFPDSPNTNDRFTENGVDYVYDGLKWKSVTLDSVNLQEFLLSTGQTTVTVANGYLPGNLLVTLNGSALGNTDYQANNGSTITLNEPASNNDILKIFAITPGFTFGDTYSKAESDTKYISNPLSSSLSVGSNGVFNIGSSGTRLDVVYANVFNGIATEAKYADLAEIYSADSVYDPGTVVEFGGEKEITQTTSKASVKVVGVISDNPAYLMNSQAEGLPVALNGRVYCKVIGAVSKGDFLVSSIKPGIAEASKNYIGGAVIGKSLVDKSSTDTELIEILVSSS